MFLFEKKDSNSFTGKRGGTKAVKCARCLFVLFLCASFLVFGCKEEPEDEDPSLPNSLLHGTWKSEYGEVFIIDLTKNTYSNPADGEWGDYSLNGNIKEIATFNSSGTAGIIYIEITSKGNELSTNGSGNFTGVHFINLTDTTVEISTASDPNAGNATPVRETQAQAKQLLNVDSVQTYFAWTSACVRQ